MSPHERRRRLKAAYREEEAAALVHGNRGRSPKHTITSELRYARARVEIHERLDGSLAVYHGDRQIAFVPAPSRPGDLPDLRVRRRHRADY